MDEAPTIKLVKGVRLHGETDELWLDCVLTDDSPLLIKLARSAVSTWVQALHAMPADGQIPRSGHHFPIYPTGSRPFVSRDVDQSGIAFQLAPGVEIQMVLPATALSVLKADIHKLEALNQEPGRA